MKINILPWQLPKLTWDGEECSPAAGQELCKPGTLWTVSMVFLAWGNFDAPQSGVNQS